MRVRVLGPVAAESGGRNVAISTNQRLLFALLAARPGQVVSADALIEELWRDEPPARPGGALQNLISRVRSQLAPGDAECLITRPPGYALAVDHESLDVIDFEQRVARARTEADPVRAIELFDAALGLWQGPAYDGFDDLAPIHAEATRLTELHAVATEARLTHLVGLDPAGAVAALEGHVAAHPYRERGHALLMDALHRTGRQGDALRAYAAYRTMLAQELGLDPSPAIQQVEREILAGDGRAGAHVSGGKPERSTAGAASTNLPRRRTSFVGRDHLVAAIATHLAEQRLVSLVGVGGAGKTSLAIEAARAAAGRFTDGVWLVDLLALPRGGQIADHAATAIGVPVDGHDDPLATLLERLRGRAVLIVLDNCEHVVAEAAAFCDALLELVDVRLLATSRERLRVPGEVVLHIDPLDVPAESAALREVLESSSGRVLVDRVSAADPRFQLEERDGALLCTICRRLDGLPLALELAAALVPALGMQQVADRLDDRFALLTNGNRGAIPHHRTLREAIRWSVDLLDSDERRLLGRLGVFVGGFDLAAVETVCSDADLTRGRVAQILAALVDRSLVMSSRTDRVVRHRLLETIREYVDAEPTEDVDDLRRRHRDWCLEIAKRAGDGFLIDTSHWYRTLRAEFANLQAAFDWSLDQGDTSAALDLAASLRWAPFNTGQLYRHHRIWIERALGASRTAGIDQRVLARGLVAAGAVAGLESRTTEALALLSEAHEVLTALDDNDEVAWCRMWLGAFTADLGDYHLAVEHTRAGMRLAQATAAGTTLVYLANQHAENAMAAASFMDDPSHLNEALDAYRIAMTVATELGIEEGRLRARNGLAVLGATSDPTTSLRQCLDALVEWRQLGFGNRLIMSLVATSRVAVLAGDEALAGRLLTEAAEAMHDVGWRQPLGRLLETAAYLAARHGDAREAATLAGAASTRFQTPRWYVPLPEDGTPPAPGFDRAFRDGGALDDADALGLVCEPQG